MIQISSLSPKESRYRIKVSIRGISKECSLTYAFSSPERNMILVNGHTALGSEIISAYGLGKLYDRVVASIPIVIDFAKDTISKGSLVGSVKTYVNQIYTDKLPGIDFAIHKFGYVPVIPLSFEHKEYVIGIYPDPKGIIATRKGIKNPPGIKNDHDFLECLKIKPYKLYRKYLEDIGEIFYLIEHSNNISDIYKYCKIIEEIKGESLDSKIKKVKKIESGVSFLKIRLKKEIQSDPAFFMAEFGRELSMLIVNEIYAIIGLADRVSDYQERIAKLSSRFELVKNNPEWSKISEISILMEILERYDKISIKENFDFGNKLEMLAGAVQSKSWIRRFGNMLLFINIAKVENKHIIRKQTNEFYPSVPRIFVSHHHGVIQSENLLRQIEGHATKNAFYNSMAILKISEKRKDFDITAYHEQFKRISKCLIWLSDKVFVLLVANLPEGKDYLWINREIEHSVLINDNQDDLAFLRENGFQEKNLLDDFESAAFDFLSLEYAKDPVIRITEARQNFKGGEVCRL